jgi:hypothetical protein
MTAHEMSLKAAVSVSQMCEMCSLSRSRWYEFLEAGVFPKPVLHPSSKRPVYDRNLQEKCLEIRATGVGLNGVPVVFNRKAKKAGPFKQGARRPANDQHAEAHVEPILDAIQALGLTTTSKVVADAVDTLYPTGIEGVDLGEIVRKVFLHLQPPRK